MRVKLFEVFEAEGEPFEVALYTEIIARYVMKETNHGSKPGAEQDVINLINEALDEYHKQNGGFHEEE